MAKSQNPDVERGQVGLCVGCQFMRRIESARGSVFYLCRRSEKEPEFPKYPRLPVIQCKGYTPQ